MPGSPSFGGLPGNWIAQINELIQEQYDPAAGTLGLQFSVANQMIGYLGQLGVANPGSYRPEIFAAVRFGIDLTLAANAMEVALETGLPTSYPPPFNPELETPYQYGIHFDVPGLNPDRTRPYYLEIPADHQLTTEELTQAMYDLIDDLKSDYGKSGNYHPTNPVIDYVEQGIAP